MSDATQSPNRVLETPVLENPVLKSPVLGTPALDVSLPGFVRRVRNSDGTCTVFDSYSVVISLST